MRSALAAFLLLAGASLTASSASAMVIGAGNVGEVYTIQFAGNVNGTGVAGLSAVADLKVVAFSKRRLILDITLTNDTDVGLVSSSRVSALGFDVSSRIRSASTRGRGLFSNAVTGGKLPNGFGALDVCITDNRNNCSGGRNGGVNEGQSGTTRLALRVSPAGTIELTNFGVRYQDVGRKGRSGTGTGKPGITPGIPEPGAAAVFAVGAALVGLTTRRRRS